MAVIEIKEIGQEYNQDILNIINRSPISTDLFSLNFDRSPDFFSLSKAGFEYSRYAGLFLDDQLMGFVGTSYYEGKVNGKNEYILYYTNLYVLPEARKHGFFFRSSEVLLKDRYKKNMLGLSIVMKGNTNATRLIGRRTEEYPYSFYSKICDTLIVKNILITLPKWESKKYFVRRATEQDIQGIVELLNEEYDGRTFAPVITVPGFVENIKKRPNFKLENYFVVEKEQKIIGVCGAIDLKSMKRTRILEYKGKFKIVKFLYQLFTPLLGLPPLPKKGKHLKDITLIDYATKGNDYVIMESLLRAIYRVYRKEKYNSIVLGSYAGDPLLKATHAFISTTVESNIILGCGSKEIFDSFETTKPYVNVAFL